MAQFKKMLQATATYIASAVSQVSNSRMVM